jgi:S-adenosylmethionine-dependent methyltransferase
VVVREDRWAPLVERFVGGHYSSLRGQVRTYVIDRQLRWHLPPPPADLVDIGGGGGNQALPLARDGYRVTIVDPSPAMLDRAHAAVSAEPEDVASRIKLVEATAGGATAALKHRHFAGVLCHGVIMYVDDPRSIVSSLAEIAADSAVVSIVAKNAQALAVRPALAGDWKAALASFDSSRQINGLGLDTRADTVDELAELLRACGVDPVDWYGVRLFTDGWTSEISADETDDDVLAVELEASRRDPYRQLSRLFHLMGVKRATSA